MSGGTLFSHLLGAITSSKLPKPARSCLYDVLFALDDPFLQFIYEAGLGAGLDRKRLLERGSALVLEYAAIQLCDDLADGDCDYLADPHQTGPVTLALIQMLFHRLITATDIPPSTIRTASIRLCSVGSSQLSELCTTRWTMTRALSTAAGLNGQQLSAYLSLLWSGTACEPVAHRIGYNLGIAIHVASDMASNDPRYRELTLREKRQLIARARRSLHIVNAAALPFLHNYLVALDKSLSA